MVQKGSIDPRRFCAQHVAGSGWRKAGPIGLPYFEPNGESIDLVVSAFDQADFGGAQTLVWYTNLHSLMNGWVHVQITERLTSARSVDPICWSRCAGIAIFLLVALQRWYPYPGSCATGHEYDHIIFEFKT